MNSSAVLPTDRFSVTEEGLRKIVGEALKGGGSYCDLYFEDSSSCEMVLRDSEVASGGFNIDYGCGVRVLDGERTGYAYSESTDMDSLMKAARAAASIAGPSSPKFTPQALPEAVSRYRQIKKWSDGSVEAYTAALKKLEAMIRARDSRTTKVIASLAYSESNILMYNSFGELTSDSHPMGRMAVKAVFSQNGATETQSVSRSFSSGAEMLTDALLEELCSECVHGIDERFAARRPKGGKMSVVMGAGASGILLHEAMGHAFEADFNRKGQSVFSEKMGKRICGKGITIVDDGTIPANRGAITYDDEGVPGQKTVMVEDGILTSYLHDRISARYYGVAPTGNGRRESFRYHPLPRMRATYMLGGGSGSCEDIIAGVKKGIYVDRFSNGQVKIGEGDFTFFVQSGFLIENGRLTMPVKDINIVGNGPKALADICEVGSDLKIDNSGWTCGKEQDAAVSCGIPSVLVRNLTVGGQK